jgi:Lrp/AsnC family leucine-responsive transcriptional regulator|tara:strand:+ start:974 stop:1540 length:567 start_codon:yes stop_codon:yes gene_type:complete
VPAAGAKVLRTCPRAIAGDRRKRWNGGESSKKLPSMEQLDATDRRILALLQKEGRISNADLALRVNLSASACHRRVQRLEAAGVISAYVALLDARKLRRQTTVFVEITLSGQTDDVLDGFERGVRAIPDVLECHLMAGTADYLLKIVVEDTDDFARIHRQFLAKLPGVQQMHSSFALRTVFRTTALPV